MSGSRLGRGRVGRLALLSCATVCVIILVFLYRTTTSEMARLRDLHVKCAQQQEALAAQLQVIYEYKVQLEKTLSNEKSANAIAKEELQQKASRERSLRDKDSVEAMQRFNSLQQNYKQLQAEHQDLKDHCKDKEDVALENTKRLESTLKDLRVQLKKVEQDQDSLKNKYMDVVNEKDQLEEKYNALKKTMSEDNGTVERLQKQVIQLQRELDETKNSPHFSVGGLNKENSQVQPRHANEASLNSNNNNNNNADNDKPAALENNAMQVIRPSSQQQAGVPSSSNSAKLGPAVAAVPPALGQSPSEISSGKPSPDVKLQTNSKVPTKVKLPVGVPPIPRLIESDLPEQEQPKTRQQESAGQAPPVKTVEAAAPADNEPKLLVPKLEEPGNAEESHQQNGNARHLGEQILNRHEDDGWYKLKPGVQEVGDPHHIEKNGFDNPGGNEDVEQYDDYNYKEPQNKNGDLHLEEGEDEREDEDDYMHNNMNAVKHE